MVLAIVVVSVVIFFLVDLSLRFGLKRLEESRRNRKRKEALELGLKLEFTDEAASLKRVEVDNPKARILAVDDEPVVLDSFRKILVLAGYSIDTVETGQEGLGLVRKNDYDFVFTDLKMPGMDGLDVTKAVHHLRPDIDIIMITGYATIETAVDAMRFGAVDHVEKPFTEDELVAFVDRALIRREDRLEQRRPPEVRLVGSGAAAGESERVINVPGDVYLSDEHAWVSVTRTGEVWIGLDEFAHKSLGPADSIQLPATDTEIERGDPLFSITRNGQDLVFPSPVSGKIVKVNLALEQNLDLMRLRPFESGWICRMEPRGLTQELRSLHLGVDALDWYREEVGKLRDAVAEPAPGEQDAAAAVWRGFSAAFLAK